MIAGLDSEHVIAVMREFTEDPDKTSLTEQRFLRFKDYLKSKIPNDSLIHLWYVQIWILTSFQYLFTKITRVIILCSVRWRTNGINPACSEHDTYLTIFQEAVMSVLQSRINDSIEKKPEVNARNKAIQVRYEFKLLLDWETMMLVYEKKNFLRLDCFAGGVQGVSISFSIL